MGLDYTVVKEEEIPAELKKLIEAKKSNTLRMTYATKDAVDSYLCSDGHPIKNSTTYGGDKDVYAQFRVR